MDREQAKQQVKVELEGYLLSKGIDPRKPFKCLNPDHADNNPSMRYDRKRQSVEDIPRKVYNSVYHSVSFAR